MFRPLPLVVCVLAVLSLACGADGTTDPGTYPTSETTPGYENEDNDCVSTGADVAADVQDAIGITCSHFVACGTSSSCASCVNEFESAYLDDTSYVQAEWAESVLCFSTLACEDLAVGDYSECTGNSCGGIYCGSDDSVCSSAGCGTCGGDGYCQ